MSKAKLAALVAAISLLAAACGGTSSEDTTTAPGTSAAVAVAETSATPAAFPVTISAANGDVEIPAMPANIVSMSATHTEMLYAIGAGDQVIAVDSFSNYPPEAPVTSLTGFAPNVEAIVGLDADLVVFDGDWDGSSVDALTRLGVPVLVLPAATTFADVYTEIEQLGAATGHIGEAELLVGEMQAEIEEILASIPESAGARTFYHELDSTYYSVTSETFIGHVYSLMGLENIADAVGAGSFGYPQLSEEYILEQNPDLIFLADAVSGDSLKERPGWDTLTAVQNGSIVELDDDVASRWGPRIVESMRAVAEALTALAVDA